MESITVAMDSSGRVLIPAEVRESLGLSGGDRLVLLREEDGFRLLTRSQAVAWAQRIVRRYIPEGTSLVDELIEDRRADDRE
jgi:AbrB family looped-hinge helix DNA binding protein